MVAATAAWGHSVGISAHAAAPPPPPPHNDECGSISSTAAVFAYRSTPSTIVISRFPSKEQQPTTSAAATAACLSPRVLNLPAHHVATSVSLFQQQSHHTRRCWAAVGTQDHGCYVFPLESSKGIPCGEAPPRFEKIEDDRDTAVSPHADASFTAVGVTTPASSSSLFTLDNKWIGKATGSTVIAATFFSRPLTERSAATEDVAGAELFLVLCTAVTNASTTAAVPTVHLSVWGVEGAVRRTLLWASAALHDVLPQHVQGLQCSASTCSPPAADGVGPWKTTIVLCTKRSVGLWRVATTANGAAPGGPRSATKAQPSSCLIDVKHRACATIPELKGAEFVSVAVPQSQPTDDDGSAPNLPPRDYVFALTTAGFLVCFDRADGSVVKWMDCKVCPASSLCCTGKHVIVCGATVRLFSLHSWDFCGKVAPPSPTSTCSGAAEACGTTSVSGDLHNSSQIASTAASGFLTSLLSGLAITAVGGGPRDESLAIFYSNGGLALVSAQPKGSGEVDHRRKKATGKVHIARLFALRPFSVPSALTSPAASSSMRWPSPQQPSSLLPRFLPAPRWSDVLIYWTGDSLRSVCRHTGAPLAYRDMETTCAVLLRLEHSRNTSSSSSMPRFINAVAAFDTTFHGLVIMSLEHDFKVIARCPLDQPIVSLLAVPHVTGTTASTERQSGGVTLLGVVPHNKQTPEVSSTPTARPLDAVMRLDVTVDVADATEELPLLAPSCEKADPIEVHIKLQSCRSPKQPREIALASTAGADDHHALDYTLKLLATDSGQHLCAVVGRWLWNVRTGTSLKLPVAPYPHVPPVSSGERFFFAGVPAGDEEDVAAPSANRNHGMVRSQPGALCVIDPTNPAAMRTFVLPLPVFKDATTTTGRFGVGGLHVDDGTRFAAVSSEAKDQIAIMSLRHMGKEMDRVSSNDDDSSLWCRGGVLAEETRRHRSSHSKLIFHAFALRGGGDGRGRSSSASAGRFPQLVVVEGEEAGTSAATVKFFAVCTGGTEEKRADDNDAKRSPTSSPSQRNYTSKVTKPVVVAVHVDPNTTTNTKTDAVNSRQGTGDEGRRAEPQQQRTRRAQSCGATRPDAPSAAILALNDRFNELQSLAENLGVGGVRRQRGVSPPQPHRAPSSQQQHLDPSLGTNVPSPSDAAPMRLVGTRRVDPFRQSGLLLTRQVEENSRTGDVVLRLGLKWADVTAKLEGGRQFEFPVIRSHNSSVCNNSAVGCGLEEPPIETGITAATSEQQHRRPAVEAALATELLMRRMHQRESAVLEAATTVPCVGQSTQHRYAAVVDSIDCYDAGTHADGGKGAEKKGSAESEELTDSMARRLLKQERSKLDARQQETSTSSPTAIRDEKEQRETVLVDEEGPTHCPGSPRRAGEEVVELCIDGGAHEAPENDRDDDDFVVCGSVVSMPPLQQQVPEDAPLAARPSPQRLAYAPSDDDDDNEHGAADLVVHGNTPRRSGSAHRSHDVSDSYDAELFGQALGTMPPPRAAFAATLHDVAPAPMETLRPSEASSEARSQAQRVEGAAQQRIDNIRRAAETVRQSIASLKELILLSATGATPQVATEDDDDALEVECAASMTEWNAVLTDVVSAMVATTQRGTQSRPSSAASVRSQRLPSAGVRPSTAGGRLTDADEALVLLSSSNGGSTLQSAVASATSAAQFHLLWSEMQRMQAQNAELLAAVTSSSTASAPKVKKTAED